MRTKRSADGESRPAASLAAPVGATLPSESDVLQQYKNASLEFGSGCPKNENSSHSIAEATRKLANDLNEFQAKLEGHVNTQAAATYNDVSEDAVEALQLQTCRKLRQLIPKHKELLHTAHERNWISLFLGWLNLQDRPAVQIEALLTLTSIAETCGTTSPYPTSTTSMVQQAAAAARAATAETLGKKFSLPSSFATETKLPLSFSDEMAPEAVAAFGASISSTLQQTLSSSLQQQSSNNNNNNNNSTSTLTSLTSSLMSQTLGLTSTSSSSSSNSFLPPPTTDLPQLSSASQHLLLRHEDAIPTLISLLASDDAQVYEQSMYILGCIASGNESDHKSVASRDVILAAGCMNALLACLERHATNLALQRLGSWTLSHLMDGIFQTSNHKSSKSDYNSSEEVNMTTLLPVLKRMLYSGDAEVLSYTCWTLSHLCDGPLSHIAAVVTTPSSKAPRGGLVPRLVELLLHTSWRVTKPALRTIGNIVCAECGNCDEEEATDYTQVIIQCGAVPFLQKLVTHNNREIQKEACWTLSNIAAGTVDQIQAVIDSGAMAPLVQLVSDKNTDQEVRSEACWVVLNATSCGSDSQIETLVKEGCVDVLGVLLSEPSMVMMALEGLERVLQVEESREASRKKGGISTPMLVSASLIEKAQYKHNSTAVKKRADRIWKQHFVSCALCHESYSKHRTADATFCEECKCHVCSKCDCKQYHLSYQEELWAATEEKTEAKKNAKKSKNKKKKQKQKKAKQASTESQSSPNKVTVETSDKLSSQQNGSSIESGSRKSRGEDSTASDDAGIDKICPKSAEKKPCTTGKSRALSQSDDDEIDIDAGLDDAEQKQPPVDFVLYLQQTGSIIALAKLMDALEYGSDGNGYNDEELDEKELQWIRNMQQQATS